MAAILQIKSAQFCTIILACGEAFASEKNHKQKEEIATEKKIQERVFFLIACEFFFPVQMTNFLYLLGQPVLFILSVSHASFLCFITPTSRNFQQNYLANSMSYLNQKSEEKKRQVKCISVPICVSFIRSCQKFGMSKANVKENRLPRELVVDLAFSRYRRNKSQEKC